MRCCAQQLCTQAPRTIEPATMVTSGGWWRMAETNIAEHSAVEQRLAQKG